MCNIKKEANDFPPATNRSGGQQAWFRICTKEQANKLRSKRTAAAELVDQLSPLMSRLLDCITESQTLHEQIKTLIKQAVQ